jgi:hypothetical protein
LLDRPAVRADAVQTSFSSSLVKNGDQPCRVRAAKKWEDAMPLRVMLKHLSAAVTVVALFATVSVPVSAQVKNQPAEEM